MIIIGHWLIENTDHTKQRAIVGGLMCIKSKTVLVVAGLHCSCTSLFPFKSLCTHKPKDALQFHKCVSHMSITSFTPKRALQMHQCLMIRDQVTTTHNPQRIPMLYPKQNRKWGFLSCIIYIFCIIHATFHPVTSQTALGLQWVLATSKHQEETHKSSHLMFLNRSGVFFSINRCMIPLIDKSWHMMCLYVYNQGRSSYKYCSIALLVDYY